MKAVTPLTLTETVDTTAVDWMDFTRRWVALRRLMKKGCSWNQLAVKMMAADEDTELQDWPAYFSLAQHALEAIEDEESPALTSRMQAYRDRGIAFSFDLKAGWRAEGPGYTCTCRRLKVLLARIDILEN